MKYDLHVHTARFSPCAQSFPEEVCEAALAQRLTGIALTEHDVWWPRRDYEALQGRYPGLTIFRGVEYALPEGHFLVYLPEPQPDTFPYAHGLAALISRVHRVGGIVVWAHPFRFDGFYPAWMATAPLDGLEVASTNMAPRIQALASETAQRWGRPGFRNSDAHHATKVGAYYNEFPALLPDTAALVAYVRQLGRRML